MAAGGVALATVIANVVSSSILFWKLTHSDTPISIHKHKLEIDFSLVKMIFIIGLPAGLGEPFFDSVESILSHLIFSVPAVKGVSFGEGFGFAKLKGSQANDAFRFNDKIETKTNHNAGINGGITNGMPIIIHTCIKPTPSIFKTQESVDYLSKENVDLKIQGRHDPCILHRARIVVDSVVAFGLLDLYMSRLAIKPLQGDFE